MDKRRSDHYPLRRREVVSQLVAERGAALIVAGLGASAWDVTAAGDSELNFPLWGAMGGASLVGLGLALAQPNRRVLVLTGDGELLMGLGGLATISVKAPSNLAIAVIDNERYGETGMQPTHTAYGVDLAAVAAGVGLPITRTVTDQASLLQALPLIHHGQGPVLVVIKVRAEELPLVLPPKDGVYLKDRMRLALLGAAAVAAGD